MAEIGIYGGTFDPIHNGHLNLAKEIMTKHQLDEVWFCPVRYSPHKIGKEVSSVEHRMKMVELAIEDVPGWKAVDFEIKRDGPSYTVDTLEELRQKFPEHKFSLILGDESVKSFLQWRKPKRILELANLLVGTRGINETPDLPKEGDPEVIQAIKAGLTQTSIVPVSGTEIREMVSKNLNIEGLVPGKVIDYIIANHLYLAPKSTK